MEHYVIAGGEEGKKRLDILSEAVEDTTKNLFRKVELTEGLTCLDIGCGGGNVSFILADIVGENGKVLGIDLDEKIINLARQDCQEKKIRNVDFLKADVQSFSNEYHYDIIYSRFLLTHLSNPHTILQQMFNLLKPGGRMIIEDIEFSGHFSYPICSAFQQYVQTYQKVVKQKGGDPDIGPKLPHLLKEVGLKNVKLNVAQPVFMEGKGKLMAQITMEKITESILEEQILSSVEISEIVSELEKFTQNPNTIISLPRIFQVWGSK